MFGAELLDGLLPIAALVLTALSALAEVPFVTDDPDTPDKRHMK